MLRKIVALSLILNFLVPLSALADPPSLVDEKELQIVVKDVPSDLKKRLGEDYILVREDYFKELYFKAEERDVFAVNIQELLGDLKTHKLYITDLEDIIAKDRAHIDRLNLFIDDQGKIIDSLQPTIWSKHKFAFGMVAGMLLVGGAAFGASQLSN